MSASLYLVGLISDTHGLIRPEALDALRDSDLIVHCGDIGDPAVLEALRTIAPVHAIRGNNDKGGWAGNFQQTMSSRSAATGSTCFTTSRNSTSIRMPRASALSYPVTLTSQWSRSVARFSLSTRAALDRGASGCR